MTEHAFKSFTFVIPFSMSPIQLLVVVTGTIVLVFGILTFAGRTTLSKRSFRFFGIEVDKSVAGMVLFFIGLTLVLSILIALLGPHLAGGMEKT